MIPFPNNRHYSFWTTTFVADPAISNSNEIRAQNQLVRKRTLNYLAKLATLQSAISTSQVLPSAMFYKVKLEKLNPICLKCKYQQVKK